MLPGGPSMAWYATRRAPRRVTVVIRPPASTNRNKGQRPVSLKDWIKGRVAVMDAAVRPWSERSRFNGWAYEIWLFGLKQAWASLFAGAMLALLVATHLFWPPHAPLARYDFLVLAAILIQAAMLA